MVRAIADKAKVKVDRKASSRAASKSRKGGKAYTEAAKRKNTRDDDPANLTPEQEVLLLHVLE